MIRVIVVDDHRLFRMQVKAGFKYDYPEIFICGDAESGEALFALPELETADLVLLDIHLPGGISGLEIALRLRKEYPNVKILTISAENDGETVKSMVMAGINGYISKQKSDVDELAQAIKTIMSDLEYFGRDIASIIYDIFVAKKNTLTPSRDEFTEREREIINLCRNGMMSKEIAAKLGISPGTVNTHKNNIFKKLNINNTMEMVQYALKKGIIRMDG